MRYFGKKKIGEKVEARGSEKMTGEKIEGGDEGQMEEQLRVGRPVKRRKIHGRIWTKNKKSKGSSKLRNDILSRGDEDNHDLNLLEQVKDVNDEVIQISSDDDEGEGIEISSDDDEREASIPDIPDK